MDSRPVLAYAYFKEEQEAVGRQAAHPRRKARRRQNAWSKASRMVVACDCNCLAALPERGHKSCERGRLHESAGSRDSSTSIQRAVSRRLLLMVCC